MVYLVCGVKTTLPVKCRCLAKESLIHQMRQEYTYSSLHLLLYFVSMPVGYRLHLSAFRSIGKQVLLLHWKNAT